MSLPCTNDPRVPGAGYPTLNVGPGWLGSLSTSFKKNEKKRNEKIVVTLKVKDYSWFGESKKNIDVYIYIPFLLSLQKMNVPKGNQLQLSFIAGPSFEEKAFFSDLPGRELKTWNTWNPVTFLDDDC